MTTLLLIRHGETAWNAESRIQGHMDSALSEKGIRQAETLALRLSDAPLAAIYASDLSRAWRTAEIINSFHRLPIIKREDLREANLGRWEGRSIPELEADESESDLLLKWRSDSVANRPPEGERLEDLQARIVKALKEIALAQADGIAAVVTHGGVLKAAVSWVLDLPLSHQRKFKISNASITRVSFRGSQPILDSLNDASHWEESSRMRARLHQLDEAP